MSRAVTKDLFDYVPPPYHGEPPAQPHSRTSIAAAESIRTSVGPLHVRILTYLREVAHFGGSTDEEMQINLDMGANTQRPRRRELELMGKIEDSGNTRPTKSGREAVVWRIV